MGKLIVYFGLIVILNVIVSIRAGSRDCPPAYKVTTCTPKCKADYECSKMGGICCANICNDSSCVIPRGPNMAESTGGNRGSGSSSAYCGNVKCHIQEKCIFDKATKRYKCVRT